MMTYDSAFQIKLLKERVTELEHMVKEFISTQTGLTDDWDISTLMLRWDISRTTVYNYRQTGLEYEERGGKIIFTHQAREKFKKKLYPKIES